MLKLVEKSRFIKSKLILEYVENNNKFQAENTKTMMLARLKPLDFYVDEILKKELNQNFIDNIMSKKENIRNFFNDFLTYTENHSYNSKNPDYKRDKPLGKALNLIRHASFNFFNIYQEGNPVSNIVLNMVKTSRAKPRKKIPINVSDISRVLDKLITKDKKNNRSFVIALLLAVTGCRVSEILTIQYKNLKLNEEIPHLIIDAEKTKTKVTRVAYLTSEAVGVLKEYTDWYFSSSIINKYDNITKNKRQVIEKVVFSDKLNDDEKSDYFIFKVVDRMQKVSLEEFRKHHEKGLYFKFRTDFSEAIKKANLQKQDELNRNMITIHSIRWFVGDIIKHNFDDTTKEWYIGHKSKRYEFEFPKEKIKQVMKKIEDEKLLNLIDRDKIEIIRKRVRAEEIDKLRLEFSQKLIIQQFNFVIDRYKTNFEERFRTKLINDPENDLTKLEEKYKNEIEDDEIKPEIQYRFFMKSNEFKKLTKEEQDFIKQYTEGKECESVFLEYKSIFEEIKTEQLSNQFTEENIQYSLDLAKKEWLKLNPKFKDKIEKFDYDLNDPEGENLKLLIYLKGRKDPLKYKYSSK